MFTRLFCKTPELIENYELAKADNFKGWDCHHRLETHNSDGERRLVDISSKELVALGMYWHRPPEELIFMRRKDHSILHKKGKPGAWLGRKHSEEQKKKISEAHKGKPKSEEHRRKISKTLKGRPNANEGRKWFNNGKVNKMCFECPEGFVPGRLR